jgi:tetratricopeptide (TPR) repeat protein
MERYRRAYRLLADHPGCDEGLDMLCECVANDPGNLIFVETFLSSLQHRTRPVGPFRGVVARARCLRAVRREDWDTVLSSAPALILLRPADAPVLHGLAMAAQHHGFDDVALRYWTLVAELEPHNPDIQRQAAVAFGLQGHFGLAMASWQRVVARHPQDQQAVALLKAFESLSPLEEDAVIGDGLSTTNLEHWVEQARRSADAGRPQRACQFIEHALTISPGDQRLRCHLRRFVVQVAEQKVRVAEQQAEILGLTAAAELAGRLEEDWRRQELDAAFDAHHRHPGNSQRRLMLAQMLKQRGRFQDAVDLLQGPANDRDGSWQEQLELGESLQHLQRFEEAYAQYQAAVRRAGRCTDEAAKLARMRAGSLALALGDVNSAARFLEELVDLDRAFPGALEKLAEAQRARDNR